MQTDTSEIERTRASERTGECGKKKNCMRHENAAWIFANSVYGVCKI